MNPLQPALKASLLLLLLLLCFRSGHTQSLKMDIDIDPIAYALNGFSVHAGFNTQHIRYDIGLFGIEVPEAFHGNEGFNNYMWGAGAKADYYFKGTKSGLFTGFGIDLTNSRVRLDETGSESSAIQFAAGMNIGYKVSITNHLFIKPWFGLSYLFNSEDVVMDGRTFEQASIRPFPTVHIGWMF
jgi:hypothetical protein